MLNHVWLALLLLGIGAAITTDVVYQSNNKFKNDYQLSAQIIYKKGIKLQDNNDIKLKVKSTEFTRVYSENGNQDVVVDAKMSFDKKGNRNTVFFKVDKNFPKIWQEMAACSGKEDDLTGYITVKEALSDTSSNVALVLEKVAFTKTKQVTNSALEYAGTAVNIALGLIGIMALWLGIMKVADEAGLIKIIARGLRPITTRIFPDVPADHPAMGSMIMNISANMLGLSNAATPFGLKAMEELDKLNPNKGTATNAMVTFLAVNTAGMTLIPASAIAIRAAAGSADPAVIIGTSLFGSTCATIAGLTAAKLLGGTSFKMSLWEYIKVHFKGIAVSIAALAAFIFLLASGVTAKLNLGAGFAEYFKVFVQYFSIFAIPLIIISFIGYGAYKKVKVYEQFIEGAKEGFNVAIRIIPYLVAMLVAIGIFRAGGAMDWLIYILRPITTLIGMPPEALPMALMRPLSGSGSLGIMAETMKVHGPDTLIGIMTSTFFGSSETTFYVLAVYFGSVNIKNTRHALPAGIIADIAGTLGAVFICRLLFG
jgi:spore maturation protein SpmA